MDYIVGNGYKADDGSKCLCIYVDAEIAVFKHPSGGVVQTPMDGSTISMPIGFSATSIIGDFSELMQKEAWVVFFSGDNYKVFKTLLEAQNASNGNGPPLGIVHFKLDLDMKTVSGEFVG